MAPRRRDRETYLSMMERLGAAWLQVFGEEAEFYSAAYWDLFTALWRSGRPMRKTEALAAMKGVKSPHTAGKYLEAAVRRGYILEEANPADARSRLIRLSPAMRRRLDGFLDTALAEVRATARHIS